MDEKIKQLLRIIRYKAPDWFDIGFLYILVNPAFSHRLKVGLTTRSPSERSNELSSPPGIPEDFYILRAFVSPLIGKVERSILGLAYESRPNKKREFLQAPLEFVEGLATRAISDAAQRIEADVAKKRHEEFGEFHDYHQYNIFPEECLELKFLLDKKYNRNNLPGFMMSKPIEHNPEVLSLQ